MPFRDFALMVAVCLVWGLNVIVSKVAVTDLSLPPLFYTAARSLVIALVVWPWLFPMPRPRWRLLLVVLFMGGGQFALLFIGLQTATPSATAIVSQLNIPMTTLLSMLILGEQVRWRRGIGIALTLSGAMIVIWDPAGLEVSTGLLFVAASAFAGSLGAIAMKRMRKIQPLRFQAWVGVTSILLLAPLSAGFETEQFARAQAAGWGFVAVVLFSALAVSVGAHTMYYHLIQTHDANLIAPLTLMTPLFTIAFAILLLGDPFGPRMALGTAVALLGVLIIVLRPNRVISKALLARNRF